ncbi:MAG: alcohol dehydrogenase catalytic domain-containing protein [Clostridiales bacterium]|nr:alcohol dehydrogenase catalytic domain-containing protein [Clostridiales bacterium]
MKCKVAILPKINEPFVIEECDLSDPSPAQVRLKVKTCTICHSDIHSVKGEHGSFEGSGTVGHEIAGIVDAVGSKVTYVKPGDRVIACIV